MGSSAGDVERLEDQTRFRVAEGFDYSRTVNFKLMEAMNHPRGSSARARAVKDLDDLLFPKRDDKYREDIRQLSKELIPNGGEVKDYDAYATGLVRVLLALMDRRNLLGGTDVEEEF